MKFFNPLIFSLFTLSCYSLPAGSSEILLGLCDLIAREQRQAAACDKLKAAEKVVDSEVKAPVVDEKESESETKDENIQKEEEEEGNSVLDWLFSVFD